MSDSYLDHIPSKEREKIKRRMRSPEEYERLRETVKGPEDLEREMIRNAEFAEAKLHLETNADFQNQAREKVSASLREHGIDATLDGARENPLEDFRVTVIEKHGEPFLAIESDRADAQDAAPTGQVKEVFALKPALQQQILSLLSSKKPQNHERKKHSSH